MQIAREIASRDERARALIGLIGHLGGDLKAAVAHEAWELVQEIENELVRADALIRLAPHLTARLRNKAYHVALRAVQKVAFDSKRSDVLVQVASYLPDELKAQALQQAGEIEDEHTHEPWVSQKIDGIKDASCQTSCIAWQGAHRIGDKETLGRAVVSLSRYLVADSRIQLLDQEWVMHGMSGLERVQTLVELSVDLPDHLKMAVLRKALQIAREIADEGDHIQALVELLPHLPDELKLDAVRQAWQAVQQHAVDEGQCIRISPSWAVYFPSDLEIEVLHTVQAISDERARARALIDLAPFLPEKLEGQAVREAWQAAQQIENDWVRGIILVDLAPLLSDNLKARVLQVVCQVTDEYTRARALMALVPHSPDRLKIQVLQAIQAIQDAGVHTKAMIELLAWLDGELKVIAARDVLEQAQQVEEWMRVEILSNLAAHMPDELKVQALEMTHNIIDEQARAEVLVSLIAHHLTDDWVDGAVDCVLQIAQETTDKQTCADVLRTLIAHLPELKPEMVRKALQVAREGIDGQEYIEMMSELATKLPDEFKVELVHQILNASQETSNTLYCTALNRLAAGSLPGDLKAEVTNKALEEARAIGDARERIRALIKLVDHVPGELKDPILHEALVTTLEISSIYRADMLTQIILKWERIGFVGFNDGQKVCSQTLHILAGYPRSELLNGLAALAPLIIHLGGTAAIEETINAISDVSRWWA